MADDVSLSSSQTEKLIQFQDLTGIDDIRRCREILHGHHWDIEVAVQDTLNMRDGTPSVFQPPPPSSADVIEPDDRRIYYAVRSWQPNGLIGWGYYLLSFPFAFLYSSLLGFFRFALNFIRPDPRRFLTDPLGDVLTFIQRFEEVYGRNHPVFYQGTYNQALNDAKRELKFMLLYLHGDEHQDTPSFCRLTLCNPQVIEFINANMLLWACSVNLPEGYRASQSLRENSYPFLAVIVLRDNRMTIVARIEGPMEPVALTQKLQQIMSENEASLIVARLERQERSLNQTLRQQQDEAYLESLKIDQEKEKKKREQQELRDREELEKREKEIAIQRKKEDIRRQKIELADQIPEEPPSNHPDTVHIMIKLPVGTRLERRFDRNHSLKYLYYFVFCHDESPDLFHIVTNFPRRILPCEPTNDFPEPPSFAEMKMGKSEMLFVQDLEA